MTDVQTDHAAVTYGATGGMAIIMQTTNVRFSFVRNTSLRNFVLQYHVYVKLYIRSQYKPT